MSPPDGMAAYYFGLAVRSLRRNLVLTLLMIGAIGVSGAVGGDKDEACAMSGIAKVADKLK